MSSRLPILAIASSLLLVASTSFAQAPAPPPGPPPAGPPPGGAYAAPPPGAPYAPPPSEEEVRFRWGISGFGGKYFVNGTGGGIGGLDLRLGAQINNMIGVYGALPLLIGAGAQVSSGTTSASTSVSAVALYGVGALADFTFSDMFFVAAGPELLRGAAAQAATAVDTTGGSTSASAEAGTFFAFEGRAGVALGSVKPNRRKCFTIGLDLHVIFTSKPMVVPLLALGYDAF